MYEIVQLQASDAEDFRSLRLDGLKRHPEAFGASFAGESAESIDFFISRLEQNVIFGGKLNSQLVGIAGFYSLQQEKLKHIGKLWGMYVLEDHRKTGLAQNIVEVLLAHARSEVEIIQLAVGHTNMEAHRFYEKCGFIDYGLEPHAFKVGEKYIDEILMHIYLE